MTKKIIQNLPQAGAIVKEAEGIDQARLSSAIQARQNDTTRRNFLPFNQSGIPVAMVFSPPSGLVGKPGRLKLTELLAMNY